MNKATFFKPFAIYSVGAALLLGANLAQADDPKLKRQNATEAHDDGSYTPVKSRRSGKNKPSIDGRNSTSAKTNTVGGAPSGQETRVPTGTHLPKTYQRKGYTSDRDPSTNIYDQNDIRFKNSDSVSETLRQVPGVNVGGPR